MTDQSTALAVAEPPKPPKPPLVAGNAPRAIVPVDFDGAYRIANVVHHAGMAPASLDSLEKVMVAILHGLEVGLTPMNALQSIAVINGRPTIWGDGAVGLIRASGLLDYMEEYYENEDKPNMKAVCVVKRKGEPKPVKTDFSMADAATAGLLKKGGPWQTYPKRMLKMRARWALRDTFSDVLKGLALREEVEDMIRQDEPAPAEPRRAPPPPQHEETKQEAGSPVTAEEIAAANAFVEDTTKKDDPISSGAAPADKTDVFPGDKPKEEAPPPDEGIPWALDRKLSDNDRDWLLSLKEAFEQCNDVMEISAEQETIMAPAKDSVSPYVWQKAADLMDQHIERVQRNG